MSGTTARDVMQQLHQLCGGSGVSALTDRELLQRFAKHRDEAAFAALVRRHAAMVFAVCRRVLGHRQDAEDVFQATFLLLSSEAGSPRWHESIANWLYRSAYHLALKVRTSAFRRRRREARATAHVPASTPVTETAVSHHELLAALDEELMNLPDKYRAPLVLCFLEGATRDEAARQLGCPLGTLKSRMERGRRLLQAALTRRGLTMSAGLAAVLLGETTGQAARVTGLVQPTVRAASLIGSGSPLTEVVSKAVIQLVHEGGRTMFPTRGMLVAALGLVMLGAVLGGHALWQTAASEPAPSRQPPEQAQGPEQPAAPPGEAPQPKAAEKSARLDRSGDPLPAEAVARMGTLRFRQPSGVACVVFLPDGKSLLSASVEGEFRMWEVGTGKELRRFGGQLGELGRLALAPDGKTLLALGGDRRLGVWDLGDPLKEPRFLEAPALPAAPPEREKVWQRLDPFPTEPFVENQVVPADRMRFSSFALSPRGTTVAVVPDPGGTVVLLDLASGKEQRPLSGQAGKTAGLAFSADGTQLATASDDSRIRVWDVVKGKVVSQFSARGSIKAGPNLPLPLVFGPAGDSPRAIGRTLAAAVSGQVTLWDLGTGKVLAELRGHKGDIYALASSPGGRLLASAGYDQTVRVWDAAAGKQLHSLTGHRSGVVALAFSPDGKILASAGHDQTIRLWDPHAGKEILAAEGHGHGLNGVAIAPDGKTVVTVGHESTVRWWDAGTGKDRGELHDFRGWGWRLVISPDGKTLASPTGNSILLTDLTTGRQTHELKNHKAQLRTFDFTTDSRLISASDDGVVIVWDVASGEELGRLKGPGPNLVYAISRDGRRLACTARDDIAVIVWDAVAGRELRRFPLPAFRAQSLAFSPDGKVLAFAGLEVPIHLVDVETGADLYQMGAASRPLGKRRSVYNVRFSPDGHTLASAEDDGVVHLWEVSTGQERHVLEGHHGPVASVAFSADGRRLVSASYDTTALLWDMTGRTPAGLSPRLTPAALAERWADLGGSDARRAYQAIRTLAATPEQALPLLRQELAVRPVDATRIAALLKDLDDDAFEVRDKATVELEKQGPEIEPLLRKALADEPSPEVNNRVRRLLDNLAKKRQAESVRRRRALEVLLLIGTPEAIKLCPEPSQR
jgi:RNA polymerase sigma factor (sigma-70 family)